MNDPRQPIAVFASLIPGRSARFSLRPVRSEHSLGIVGRFERSYSTELGTYGDYAYHPARHADVEPSYNWLLSNTPSAR